MCGGLEVKRKELRQAIERAAKTRADTCVQNMLSYVKRPFA
jgi:hypothetical protein